MHNLYAKKHSLFIESYEYFAQKEENSKLEGAGVGVPVLNCKAL
jgi:hypothetical protein